MAEEKISFDENILCVFIPIWVQVRISNWELIRKEILNHKDFINGRETIEKSSYIKNNNLEEIISRLLKDDTSAIALRVTVYRILLKHRYIFDDIFNRSLTNGNEQCPYWQDYSTPPNKLNF